MMRLNLFSTVAVSLRPRVIEVLDDTERTFEFLQGHRRPKLSANEGSTFTHNTLPEEMLPASNPLPAR